MVSRILSTATPHFRTINFSLIIPYYAENYNPFCRIKSTEFGSAEIMDNPSTWDELYDKTKAARRRHWNFIGRKQGDNIEIFCAASTARLTRNRVGGIVECLCHAAGILRGHQILHHIADGSARRKFVFRDGERHTEKSSIYQQPPLPICEKFLIDCASRGGWFYVCGTNTFC